MSTCILPPSTGEGGARDSWSSGSGEGPLGRRRTMNFLWKYISLTCSCSSGSWGGRPATPWWSCPRLGWGEGHYVDPRLNMRTSLWLNQDPTYAAWYHRFFDWFLSILARYDLFYFIKRYLNILRGLCRVTALNKDYKINILTSTAYGAKVC